MFVGNNTWRPAGLLLVAGLLACPAGAAAPAGSEEPGLPDAQQNRESQQVLPGLAAAPADAELRAWLSAADEALAAQRILEPEGDSALYYFRQVLHKDPYNGAAISGLERVQQSLLQWALESARELDFETADAWLAEAAAVHSEQRQVEEAREQVEQFRRERALDLEAKVLAALEAREFGLVDRVLIELIALGGQDERVDSLRTRLHAVRHYGGYRVGQVFSDPLLRAGGTAPDVVVVAAGSFLMGSRGRFSGTHDSEKPRHRVTLEEGFGLGVREVTVADFRLFVEHSGYRTTAERKGSSIVYDEAAGRLTARAGVGWAHDYRGRKADPEAPVVHVSLHDAQAYVRWLSAETGKAYRLPSEAEFEYVASAAGSGNYWWGEGSPPRVVENLTGDRDESPGKRKWTTAFKKYGDGHWGPAPAGSLGDAELPHPMGVRDIAGNVSEWTEDCWHQNYVKAPTDGSAWLNPGCERRVVRGGYWASSPEHSRASFRLSAKPDSYGPVVGIRIARGL